ncbi:hypothetical protein LDO32_11935 [Luteimonas sp. Y-2-2-4F]|nr:hypothetical protein [Luteimonas sp. Y-2-2-4F]MCD9032436.1 hypothetical protein [Luteimonas sp. Y-2-2-4F]
MLGLIATLIPLIALAGLPFEATLEEMAQQADHILIGRVVGVDMIDGAGRQVSDEMRRTGPGSRNTIRLHIQVDEVLVTNAAVVPEVLPVPLASHLHYSLGQIRQAHAGDTQVRLVMLKGAHFEGIKPGVFLRPLGDREEALRLYADAQR